MTWKIVELQIDSNRLFDQVLQILNNITPIDDIDGEYEKCCLLDTVSIMIDFIELKSNIFAERCLVDNLNVDVRVNDIHLQNMVNKIERRALTDDIISVLISRFRTASENNAEYLGTLLETALTYILASDVYFESTGRKLVAPITDKTINLDTSHFKNLFHELDLLLHETSTEKEIRYHTISRKRFLLDGVAIMLDFMELKSFGVCKCIVESRQLDVTIESTDKGYYEHVAVILSEYSLTYEPLFRLIATFRELYWKHTVTTNSVQNDTLDIILEEALDMIWSCDSYFQIVSNKCFSEALNMNDKVLCSNIESKLVTPVSSTPSLASASKLGPILSSSLESKKPLLTIQTLEANESFTPNISVASEDRLSISSHSSGNIFSFLMPSTRISSPKKLNLLRSSSSIEQENFKTEKFDISTLSINRVDIVLNFSTLSSLSFMIQGSNSNIYTGKLAGYDRKIVLKILMQDPPERDLAYQDFIREGEILSRISHYHVVEYYGGGKHNLHNLSLPFLVLQRLKGGTLKGLLARCISSGTQQSFLDYSFIIDIGRSLASALNYLHNEFHPDIKCIHRDLKPDNIGFTEDGILKLMDFGLCACVHKMKSINGSYTMTGYTGSLRYMAPEVIMYQPYNEKVDIYSYGIIMWYVATVTTPYKELQSIEFSSKVVDLCYRPSLIGIPMELGQLISQCWDADPIKRISTDQLLLRMQKLYNESPIDEQILSKYFNGRKISMKKRLLSPVSDYAWKTSKNIQLDNSPSLPIKSCTSTSGKSTSGTSSDNYNADMNNALHSKDFDRYPLQPPLIPSSASPANSTTVTSSTSTSSRASKIGNSIRRFFFKDNDV